MVDEAYRLLAVCGPRRLFYSVQLWAGLRVEETAALEWRDLDLNGDRPAIRLRAETTKSRRADVVPLHPGLGARLRDAKPALAGPTDRVFKTTQSLVTLRGCWYEQKREDGTKVRKYRRGDLDRAGIVFTDGHGRTIDRHAMKTTFTSWLGACGVDPRAQGALARHVPRDTTQRHYQDLRVFDSWAEIAKLPPIRTDGGKPDSIRRTGTDDADVAPQVAPRPGRKGKLWPLVAASGRMGREVSGQRHTEKTLENKEKTAVSRP